MRTVFADTFYWLALISPRDQWHSKAREVSTTLKDARLVTSEPVIIELLNYFSGYGPEMREAVVRVVRAIYDDPNIEVAAALWFHDGFLLYESRPDKAYSMTDCISMIVMRKAGMVEVLTHDHHFAQEGFVVLL